MPYIETLTSGAVANTPAAIFRAMCDINNCTDKQFRVSVVYRTRNGNVLCVGDSLDAAGGKKKRWWEKKKKPTGQLRLPFPLYEPAQVIGAEYGGSNGMMKVKIKRRSDLSKASYTVTLTHNGNGRGNVLAIKIHTVTRKLVEEEDQSQPPFALTTTGTQPTNSEPESTPSSETSPSRSIALRLLNEACQNGMQITPTGVVYDARTGRRVGDNSNVLELPQYDRATLTLRLCGIDGETYGVTIDRCMVQYIDERGPTALECVELLEAAIRVGLVVTTTGDVYNRETGRLIGSAIQVEMTHYAADNEPYRLPRYASGSLRMLNNEERNFQMDGHDLTYVASETFVRVGVSQRSARFIERYGSQMQDYTRSSQDLRREPPEDRSHRASDDVDATQSLAEQMRALGRSNAPIPTWTEDLDLNMSSWRTNLGEDDE